VGASATMVADSKGSIYQIAISVLVMNLETSSPALALQHTFLIPAHVSALTYTQNGMLILGSGEFSYPSTRCSAQLER